ncbi:hypothetical protein [Nocardia sp. alder85J]|uniref:hypothetical protein n=1 Tax=Nocardia sp. alder85J TaxID=2862949 RepID=UPI001CD772CF|nr:hypothetical protein [Nocardia sp. alder85J]MCX4098475.1 hypothetical protein [Nocardia sp. alder85J]
MIVAGVAGLVVVAGIGVAIGVDAGRHDDDMPAAVSSHLAVTSAAPRPAAAPGMYSMDAVTDACDLVDPTSLSRWSSTPGESIHREYPASSGDGGTLLCRIRYIGTSASADEAAGEAGISLQVQFTDTTAVPAYDRWSLDDTAPGPDRDVDAVSGIGARGYRRYDIETTDQAAGVSATVGVQDSNVSVRVEVAVLRSDQQSPAEGDELVTIAENQARATLDGLRKGR